MEGTGGVFVIDMPPTTEPQSSVDTENRRHSNPTLGPAAHGLERELTLVALWLAALEKAATGFGALALIWATVVLLGGFAITLGKTDFWFITIILIIEGGRIFSRSHQLEWQQGQGQATFLNCFGHTNVVRKLTRINAFHRRKTMPTPFFSFSQWVFLPEDVSKVLSWLQLAFATACAVLSLMKLIERNYGEVEKKEKYKRNRQAALTIFYSLALAEAVFFLLEKAYWQWQVIHCKVLEEVNKECGRRPSDEVLEEVNEVCGLGPSDEVFIRRFFNEACSRSIKGSIFDGLKMDMVSHAMDLLDSNWLCEQLIGIRVLRNFATNKRFSDDTFRKIGTTLPVMEKLVEMLNWKEQKDKEIRQSAAVILSKLASQKQYAIRISGIPSAMESISSLLQNHRMTHGLVDEIPEKITIYNEIYYDKSDWKFNYLGILILKNLAGDHNDCRKMGNTRGLLPKIIDCTNVGEGLLKADNVTTEIVDSQLKMVEPSLQALKMLASTTGTTGEQLRYAISADVYTISNIRDIVKYGEKHRELQKLGIEILTSLAIEADATERIGATGGVLEELFNIFFKMGIESDVRIAAGEALAMLAFESKSNCCRILELKVIGKLVKALEVPFGPLLRVNAAKILKNLCIYVGADCFMQQREFINAASVVLRAITSENNKVQETMAGLAANVFKFMTSEESSIMFERAGIQEDELASVLVQILKNYHKQAIKTPRIRRFVIELAIWMMTHKETNVQRFKDLGMKNEMESVIETTADLENFSSFFGGVGMSRHSTTIHSLVVTAMKLMEDRQ